MDAETSNLEELYELLARFLVDDKYFNREWKVLLLWKKKFYLQILWKRKCIFVGFEEYETLKHTQKGTSKTTDKVKNNVSSKVEVSRF